MKKPVPPPGMWEQMDKEVLPILQRPKEAFTSVTFAAHYKLSKSKALRILRRFVDDGKVERRGAGNRKYYTWKNNGMAGT